MKSSLPEPGYVVIGQVAVSSATREYFGMASWESRLTEPHWYTNSACVKLSAQQFKFVIKTHFTLKHINNDARYKTNDRKFTKFARQDSRVLVKNWAYLMYVCLVRHPLVWMPWVGQVFVSSQYCILN